MIASTMRYLEVEREEQIPVLCLRQSTHRARRDLDNGRIRAGEVYDQWVGIVDGEFTVDRWSHRDIYEM